VLVAKNSGSYFCGSIFFCSSVLRLPVADRVQKKLNYTAMRLTAHGTLAFYSSYIKKQKAKTPCAVCRQPCAVLPLLSSKSL
jgi:DNA relaxase NicK